MMEGTTCASANCGKPASLQCPTCVKLNILHGSLFCQQTCFKSNWKTHKTLHSKTPPGNENQEIILNHTPVVSHNKKKVNNPWPGYKFTGPLRPAYPLSTKRRVPPHIKRPDYADEIDGWPSSEMKVQYSNKIRVLSKEEIEGMRVVCRLARECLDAGARAVRPGVTTDEIDRIVHEATVERNCYPSPLNYLCFPKSCCTSINEVICHGIPDKRELQDGDIVNLDITCYYNGFHGDVNETLFVGDNVDEESKRLVQTAYSCLAAAIAQVKPGVAYRDLGQYIEKHACDNGFTTVKTFCGHGINQLFHTAPDVPHYAKNKTVGVMRPGHTFTIEPMINVGVSKETLWPDKWTATTKDGRRSAQFEQTLLVTETGVDILTRRSNSDLPYFMDTSFSLK